MIQAVFILLAWGILVFTKDRIRVDVTEFSADFREYSPLWLTCFFYSAPITALLRYLVFSKGLSLSTLVPVIIYFVFPITAIVLYLRFRRPACFSNVLRSNRVEMALTVTGFFLMTVVQVFYALELRQGRLTTAYNISLIGTSAWVWAMIWRTLVFGVYIAISEELFFRVALFSLLQKLGIQSRRAPIYLSSIIFGLLHLIPIAGQQGLYLFVVANAVVAAILGVLLGHVYLWAKNLLHVVFIHWLINLANDIVVELMTVLLIG